MRKKLLIIALSFIVISLSAQQTQNTDTSANQQRPRRPRPVIGELSTNPTVHDPVMAKEGDTYYVFIPAVAFGPLKT